MSRNTIHLTHTFDSPTPVPYEGMYPRTRKLVNDFRDYLVGTVSSRAPYLLVLRELYDDLPATSTRPPLPTDADLVRYLETSFPAINLFLVGRPPARGSPVSGCPLNVSTDVFAQYEHFSGNPPPDFLLFKLTTSQFGHFILTILSQELLLAVIDFFLPIDKASPGSGDGRDIGQLGSHLEELLWGGYLLTQWSYRARGSLGSTRGVFFEKVDGAEHVQHDITGTLHADWAHDIMEAVANPGTPLPQLDLAPDAPSICSATPPADFERDRVKVASELQPRPLPPPPPRNSDRWLGYPLSGEVAPGNRRERVGFCGRSASRRQPRHPGNAEEE